MNADSRNSSSGETAEQILEGMILWAKGLALVLLVVVVYWPTLDNDYIWDDDSYITNNATLRSAQGLADMWIKPHSIPQYYPLVHTSYWLEYHFWELEPKGYHVDNMLLHALAAVLTWRLLVRLAVPGAWLGAALFAVHPVAVESVAWVTERKNVLSCVMALGSLLAYLRFLPPVDSTAAADDTKVSASPAWRFYALSLVFFLGALLSKTVTASVPAVLVVIYWWKQGWVSRRMIATLVPMFAIGLCLAAYTVWLEKHHVGASGSEWDMHYLERLLLAGRVAWFYAGKLVWPNPLIFFYPRWEIDQRVWWQYLYPLAALAVIVVLWLLRRRIGRGPLAAVLIFVGVLVPALGFFDVFPFRYSFVADHFQYHACIALLALMAASLTTLRARLPRRTTWLPKLIVGCMLVALAWKAHQKTYAYRGLGSLYRDTIALNPMAWAAHVNLGCYLEGRGQPEEAIVHFKDAVRLDPRKRPRLNLAGALSAAGHHEEAVEQLEMLLGQEMTLFERGLANSMYAIVLIRQDRFDEAIKRIKTALEIWPNNSDAYFNWGVALERKGELDEAIEKMRASIALAPGFPTVHHDLGRIYLLRGRKAEAIAELDRAVALKPLDPQFQEDLGEALWKVGDLNKAEDHLRKAIMLNTRSANAHNMLGAVIGQRGNLAGAIVEFETALRIDPQHPLAGINLRTARQAMANGR